MKNFARIAGILATIPVIVVGQSSSVSPPGRSAPTNAVPPQPPQYAVIDLGPVDTFGEPIKVGNNGWVISDEGMRWDGTAAQQLASGGEDHLYVNDMNNLGDAVGYVVTTSNLDSVNERKAALWLRSSNTPTLVEAHFEIETSMSGSSLETSNYRGGIELTAINDTGGIIANQHEYFYQIGYDKGYGADLVYQNGQLGHTPLGFTLELVPYSNGYEYGYSGKRLQSSLLTNSGKIAGVYDHYEKETGDYSKLYGFPSETWSFVGQIEGVQVTALELIRTVDRDPPSPYLVRTEHGGKQVDDLNESGYALINDKLYTTSLESLPGELSNYRGLSSPEPGEALVVLAEAGILIENIEDLDPRPYWIYSSSDIITMPEGWANPTFLKLSDNGSFIAGTATKNSVEHAILLLKVDLEVVDRDDPTKKWGDEEDSNISAPIYSGENNGDMVKWSIGGGSLSSLNFTWTAEGPEGENITGPTGLGEDEWTIHDADDDETIDWLNWDPGLWTIKVQIGSAELEFEQEIGVRTTDVVVVGWINPAGVPLDSTGLPSDMTRYYPPSGTFNWTAQKLLTFAHIGLLSQGATIRPGPAVAMTEMEKEYILNWMFKYAANSEPPNSFADESALEDFKGEQTSYKLYNRFQIRYFISEDGTEFKDQPEVLQQDTVIGITEDPIFGSPTAGTLGPNEGRQQIKDNKVFHQTNDGSPGNSAVAAFNTLVNPIEWNHIGSTISLGLDFDLRFEILSQAYPTYFIYERQKDGDFELKEQRSQAPNPKDNFNSNPYDPPLFGPAPFIISQ